MEDEEIFEIYLDIATLGLVVYYRRNVLALLTPLIIDEGIADQIVTILDEALDTGRAASIARKARLAKEFANSKLSQQI
jgi:adenosylmethionine-8-amino-7-oxononanoate aminotransferase